MEDPYYNLYSFGDYYDEMSKIHGIEAKYLSSSLMDEDKDEDELVFYKGQYRTESEFHRLLYSDFMELIERARQIRLRNTEDKKDAKMRRLLGDVYERLDDIRSEYGVAYDDVLTFLQLPQQEDYSKFRRNVTKKYNRLLAMRDIENKNSDQLNSLKNFNLVKFKMDWINSVA